MPAQWRAGFRAPGDWQSLTSRTSVDPPCLNATRRCTDPIVPAERIDTWSVLPGRSCNLRTDRSRFSFALWWCARATTVVVAAALPRDWPALEPQLRRAVASFST